MQNRNSKFSTYCTSMLYLLCCGISHPSHKNWIEVCAPLSDPLLVSTFPTLIADRQLYVQSFTSLCQSLCKAIDVDADEVRKISSKSFWQFAVLYIAHNLQAEEEPSHAIG